MLRVAEKTCKGLIEGVWVTREFGDDPIAVKRAQLFLSGLKGDRHSGISMISGVRHAKHIQRGTEMLNTRQISIVSTEELEVIALSLGVPKVLPEDLDANIAISGIKNLSLLPFGTIIKTTDNAVLTVTGSNEPCITPGQRLERRLGDNNSIPSLASHFVGAAMDRRGVMAMCLVPGHIRQKSVVEIVVPPQITYNP